MCAPFNNLPPNCSNIGCDTTTYCSRHIAVCNLCQRTPSWIPIIVYCIFRHCTRKKRQWTLLELQTNDLKVSWCESFSKALWSACCHDKDWQVLLARALQTLRSCPTCCVSGTNLFLIQVTKFHSQSTNLVGILRAQVRSAGGRVFTEKNLRHYAAFEDDLNSPSCAYVRSELCLRDCDPPL